MKHAFLTSTLLVVTGIMAVTTTFAQLTREVTRTVPISKDGWLAIDTYKGSIIVEPWEKPEVNIVARIEADEEDRCAEEKVRNTEIIISAFPNSVRIETDYDRVEECSSWLFGLFRISHGSLPFVHYTIRMPATVRLRVKDYKSETKLTGLRSEIDLDTYKGTVDIRDMVGSVALETYKGDAHVEFTKMVGRNTFDTYKGRIEIVVPQGSGFDLHAELDKRTTFRSNLDSSLTCEPHEEQKERDISIWRTINGGGSVLSISSHKGDIILWGR
ncbi:MAG: DUF4097 family beta strand repeat-containing protein [Bacteroidota bacterium]